ncbi:MAG: pyruvate kinase, partial [Halanaerobiales bacterium]
MPTTIKTKIVATLGPASRDKQTIRQLIEAGMDVARLNFSHGNHQEHKQKIDRVKEVEGELGKPIGIMLDTQGPEIRTGELEEDEVILNEGEKLLLVPGKFKGTAEKIPINYDTIADFVEPGCPILLDDGLIELRVEEVKGKQIECLIINGGPLAEKKSINIPGVCVDLPGVTEKDEQDIRFGIKNGIHFIAASFVRKAENVIEIRKLLEEEWAEGIKIIAKIENEEAVNNINEIIEVSDGIMIARGDLGVETPPEKVPVIQKMIIEKCNEAAIPVITATQMLNSMIENPRPTRAESSDVANAIYDGTDATMLSGETAVGKHPVKAVETMDQIAREVEKSPSYRKAIRERGSDVSETVTEAISYASHRTAMDLDAEAIITATGSGYTARMVSKYRALLPVIAVTPNEMVQHTLTLLWGVSPLLVCQSTSTDEMVDNAVSVAMESGLVQDGDLVTVTAGVPVGIPGTTNMIRVEVVGKPIIEGQGVGKGIVSGNVVFARTADEAIEKVSRDEILVTRMT